ncbi:helix-turn-helix domain-containing protein [Noviherbaspirillum sp.]|uniref:AraC family transcriptional regulator n=1 Tax=Noviherbaspirillum sp. TaxID=1926288 RepID=UPI002D2F5554|nr:helix-turn-helix domain-containing protein [Noviherbaspirillum sp.]HZW21288.1 helix-turn-helix domain-containing protein [Noviherbaspirillum sp.]
MDAAAFLNDYVNDEFPPGPGLEHLAYGLWDVRATSAAVRAMPDVQLLPEVTVSLAFQYGDPLRLTMAGRTQVLGSHITGVHDSAVQLHGTGALGSVVVKLTPWGAARLFRSGMHALAACHTALRDVVGAVHVEHIEQQLAEAADAPARVAAVRQWLLDMLDARESDALVAWAFREIAAQGGAVRTAELAARLGMSERQLERRFLAWVGMPPKSVARVVRLHRLAAHFHSGLSWAQIAAEAGFSDQAHMVREFRAMTGTTPARFLPPDRELAEQLMRPTLHASAFFNRAVG